MDTNTKGHQIMPTDVERFTLRMSKEDHTVTVFGRVVPSKIHGAIAIMQVDEEGDSVKSMVKVIGGVETAVETQNLYILSKHNIVRRKALQVNLHYGEFEALGKDMPKSISDQNIEGA